MHVPEEGLVFRRLPSRDPAAEGLAAGRDCDHSDASAGGQPDCTDCPARPVPGCAGDGGQLLGPREDAGDMRSGRPGPRSHPIGDDCGLCLAGYTAPVTRSPLDPWHSEEYLIGCLVKLHGWHWLEPRVLKGPWRRTRVRSFLFPEGE